MSGPWPAAHNLSHGYCRIHYRSALQEIEAYLATLEQQQRARFAEPLAA